MRGWLRRLLGGKPEPVASVVDTGDAATDGGIAVSGYRGPTPGEDGTPTSVRISGTGDATAIGPHSLAVSGSLTVQRGPQEPAVWPHQVGVIPPPAQSFQNRALSSRLDQALRGGGTAVLGQVLTGMGGVGKTQLAADHARTAWRDGQVDVLVWVTASNRTTAVSGFANAGVELCRANPNDPESAAASFLAWLQPKPDAAPCRWLVVLDDVQDPGDLRGLWPPTSPLGQTVATTRSRDAALAGAGRHMIEVGLFTPEEALAYLNGALAVHGRTEPANQLAALAHGLGHLPLALSQAAAYIADAAITVPTYRALLADRATALADAAPDTLPDDQNHTTAAALTLSLDRADTLRPHGLARPMLQLAAFLDPNGIPDAVLTSTPALAHLTHHRTGLPRTRWPRWWPGNRRHAHTAITETEATAALRALHRLHLIDHTPEIPYQAVRVHQLTQRAVRDTLAPLQHHSVALTAADSLSAAWPEIERDTDIAQALRANTTSLTDCAEDDLHQPDAHGVLFRTGRSFGESGQVTAARDHFQQLFASNARLLGPEHPDTLAARINLAAWQGEMGDAAGAASAFEELLHDRLRVLGPDHPRTLTTRNNLATWRAQAGDVTGATSAFEELLHDRLRVLGPDHPDTLTTRNNLATSRGEMGDVTGATSAFEELLHDQVRVLGPDHPDTLTTRNNLAHWRGRAGDVTGAASAFEELLHDQVRVLGPNHPDTLTTRNNLAHWRGRAGDATGAASAFEELLHDQVRVLGPNHPRTLTTRNNLATSRGEMGDATGATSAFEELLHDQVRVLGPNHPRTLTTRNSLATWRGRAGDATGAASAFEELLHDQVRVLGPNHPDTLTTRNNLATWRERAGRE
ncbi:tetratricopeptide repeat protein [Streptomyces sp. NPDC003688]